jgi:two-component system, cell cycle response regulator DivK
MLNAQQDSGAAIIMRSGDREGVLPQASEGGLALVLIVEDNILSQRLFNDLLEVHGYSTRVTASGEDALLLAQTEPPDLILMDLQLPDLSGIEAIRRLKADPSTRDIPIVVVTASLLPEITRRAWASGCDGFIEKPISIDGFMEEIRRHLTGGRSPQPAAQ